jgi:hypothetical protein
MRYLSFILAICLSSNIVLAQSSLKATRFVNEFIAEKTSSESAFFKQMYGKTDTGSKILRNDMFYQDSVGTFVIKNMREGLQRNTNVFRGVRDDSVSSIDSTGKRTILSKDDAHKLSFNSVGNDGRVHYRIEQILADSLIITSKERQYITSQINKMENHKWNKSEFSNLRLIACDTVKAVFADPKADGWREMGKKGVGRIYSLSVPVFLRNDTFCFFYYDYSCGWLCGQGQFAIYKKVKGKWVMFATLSSWIS